MPRPRTQTRARRAAPPLELVAESPAAALPPTPHAYKAIWWPAQIVLPDGTLHRIAKVIAASEGLYVYDRVPHDRVNGLDPAWYAPIDFDKTATPRTGYATREKNVRISTGAGEVVISPLVGCGCGLPLKSWRPAWSHRNEAWS